MCGIFGIISAEGIAPGGLSVVAADGLTALQHRSAFLCKMFTISVQIPMFLVKYFKHETSILSWDGIASVSWSHENSSENRKACWLSERTSTLSSVTKSVKKPTNGTCVINHFQIGHWDLGIVSIFWGVYIRMTLLFDIIGKKTNSTTQLTKEVMKGKNFAAVQKALVWSARMAFTEIISKLSRGLVLWGMSTVTKTFAHLEVTVQREYHLVVLIAGVRFNNESRY